MRPPLTPIPVSGPFDRIGVDIIQFPRSKRGNQYAVVFVDYLTKWPEVFAVPDQSAATVAKLLVEEVVSRHGVPTEVLSDRGRAFLSGLMEEVGKILGFRKINTTAYHPQTDGLVERYNRTLTAMLAKTVDQGTRDWDEQIPFVLFAYRACQQQSTQESPFYLLYGRDPRLPTEAALSPTKIQTVVGLREYGTDLCTRMSAAWESARKMVGKAQKRQKCFYDQKTRPPNFVEGERVFLFQPAVKTGEARKLARPFHGPYRIISLDTNTTHIRQVDEPQGDTILVALSRLRRCPDELGDSFWPPQKGRKKPTTTVWSPSDSNVTPTQVHPPSPTPKERVLVSVKGKSNQQTASRQRDMLPKQDGLCEGNKLDEPLQKGKPAGTVGRWRGRLRSHQAVPSAEDA